MAKVVNKSVITAIRGKTARQYSNCKDFVYYLEIECFDPISHKSVEIPVEKEVWERAEMGYRCLIKIEQPDVPCNKTESEEI